jgi:hypothetical protein
MTLPTGDGKLNRVPGTDTAPAAVNKYLLPNEGYSLAVRPHPSILVPPFAAAAGGIFAAAAASVMPGDTGTPELVVWILVIFLILKFILNAVDYLGQYIVSQRSASSS